MNPAAYTPIVPVLAGSATGCIVPNPATSWGMTPTATTTGLTTSATLCQAGQTAVPAAGMETLRPDMPVWKGILITCAANYFPTQGIEGAVGCGTGAAQTSFFTPATTSTDDYWYSNTWAPVEVGGTYTRNGTQLTGTSALVCSQGCLLPTTLCTPGTPAVWNPWVMITAASGLNTNTCVLRPNTVNFPTGLTFVCHAAGLASTAITVSCTAASTAAVFSTPFTATQCGPVDGAVTSPIWNMNGVVNSWASPLTQTAGQIRNFPAVTSVRSLLFTVASSTSNALRYWNNNPAQVLKDGNVYQVAVTGCTDAATRTQCVQQTLNWWRCYNNFPFNSGTTCIANNVQIACPTHELGFRCPSSSKKGLLGLLGLLGLIPLFLLCCCLFFLCCIRRRKTEADVHFATFDPHAAPVVGAPCATATAIPTAFGACATPYPTHSAIPVL